MFFAWDITVPANTLQTAPVTQILKCTAGIITRIETKFPAGCHGYVKVKLLHSEFRFFPLSDYGWISGDDETVGANMYYDLTRIPYQLKFVACSDGSTYQHTITVRVTVLPKLVASLLPVFDKFDKLFRYFGLKD